MTLSAIIKGCKQHKRKEQRLLFEQFSNGVFVVAKRYLNTTAAAEEITSESFIKCFQAITTFDFINEAAFWAWLKRITINECLTKIRKNEWVFATIDEEEMNHLSTVENMALAQMNVVTIQKMIASLPEGYRVVFNLFAIEGYSHKEIAVALSISEATSRSQYYKARQQLMNAVKKINDETF